MGQHEGVFFFFVIISEPEQAWGVKESANLLSNEQASKQLSELNEWAIVSRQILSSESHLQQSKLSLSGESISHQSLNQAS